MLLLNGIKLILRRGPLSPPRPLDAPLSRSQPRAYVLGMRAYVEGAPLRINLSVIARPFIRHSTLGMICTRKSV
jgi:hypothetical protein